MSDYQTSVNDPDTAKAIAERYGFCLVRDVFNPTEMQVLERDMAATAGENGGAFPDLFSCPSLRRVMLDPRVRAVARALLGETLVYYRETSIAYEEKPGPATLKPYNEFHCDARGTRDYLELAWDGGDGRVYPVYRFALYFRNYRDYSGGLKVAVGSHLRPMSDMLPFKKSRAIKTLPKASHLVGGGMCTVPVPPFELYNIPSVPGDLVVFNLRTFHTAGALRLRGRPDLSILPQCEEDLRSAAPQICLPPAPGCRNVIFFDFGAPTEEADFYAKWRALRRPLDPDNGPYVHEATDGLSIKDYAIITGLANWLTAALSDPNLTTLDAAGQTVRGNLECLLDLCAKHEELSPYHPLFDKAAFVRDRAIDPLDALRHVCSQISTARSDMERRVAAD